jgi:seryl-tRNA(Sec) selenium transferase
MTYLWGTPYPLVAGMEAKVKINMIRIFLKMFSLDAERHINNILDQIISMFEKRNEIAHSVLIQDQKKGAPIKFQDLRARIKLGHMPQAQVRTAKEIAGHARQLVTLCQQLETALTRAGVPTTIQLYANVVARHEFESQMSW